MEEKKYTITQLSKMLGIAESTIRKYESDFHLKIPRNELGNRYFTEKDLELFNQILDFKNKGFNIHQIRELLNKSILAEEQYSQALNSVKVEQLTVHELKETMSSYIAEVIMQKEEELTRKYESKLEIIKDEIVESVQENISSENQKLINYINKNREVHRQSGFFNRIFKKK